MNDTKKATLDAIYNFILFYTSDENERDRMFECALDYLDQDHVLNEEAQ
jgi:hypothetical protein